MAIPSRIFRHRTSGRAYVRSLESAVALYREAWHREQTLKWRLAKMLETVARDRDAELAASREGATRCL